MANDAAELELMADFVCANLKAASDAHVLDHQRRLNEVIDTFKSMSQRATRHAEDGLSLDAVLSYARRRVEIPLELPAPAGKTSIGALKAWHRNQFDRHVAQVDATLRAELEKRLTTAQSNLH